MQNIALIAVLRLIPAGTKIGPVERTSLLAAAQVSAHTECLVATAVQKGSRGDSKNL